VSVRDREPGGGQPIGGVLALAIPETPIVHLSDDAGTVYSVASALGGGGGGTLRGTITFTPAPPASAKQLTIAVVGTTDDPRSAWRSAQGDPEPPASAPRLDILL
jgi:hypothetical protein